MFIRHLANHALDQVEVEAGKSDCIKPWFRLRWFQYILAQPRQSDPI